MNLSKLPLLIGSILVVGGAAFLLWIIPYFANCDNNKNIRTDVYSSRAAYFSVITGIIIIVIWILTYIIIDVIGFFTPLVEKL